jgi:signal transduction histidine kinase
MLVMPLIVWFALGRLHNVRPQGHVILLTDARFTSVAGVEPPGDGAGWAARSLPDDWRRHPLGIYEGWYAFTFPREALAATNLAISLPSLSMNAAVYLNGAFLGDGGSFEEPIARNWARSLFFPAPSAYVVPGRNTVHIHVGADLPDTGFLGPVYVGDRRELAAFHGERHLFQVTSLWIITILRLLIALFTAALWMQRRREAYYGWFAATVVAWAAADLNLLVVDIPVSTASWYAFWYASIGWFSIFALRLVLDFIGERHPPVESGVMAYGALGSVVLAGLAYLRSPWLQTAALYGWLVPALLAAMYGALRVLAALRRDPQNVELQVILVLGMSAVGSACHDLSIEVGLVARGAGQFTPYTASFVVLVMGWLLLRRFVGALRQSEALVVDLEDRVRQKHEELVSSYDRLREMERARILAEERERILRDMHDGVGSHLVSALAMIEHADARPAEVGQVVRGALDDLRLMIDSLDPVEGDLLTALAMLRSRMQPRLEAGGLRVQWRVAEVPAIADFGAPKVLQALRVVQEAFSNVLQHARATTITVRTGTEDANGRPRSVFVEVADDGRGFEEKPATGRGIEGMRLRARKLGGEVEIRSTPDGTAVRLWIPTGEHP